MATNCDDKTLEGLLNAFGDECSLEDIASAYCQAGKDAQLAAQFLYKCDADASSSTTYGSSSETKSVDSLDGSFVMVSNKPVHVKEHVKKTKQIWRPVSAGTSSGQFGNNCVSSKPFKNESSCLTKPLKGKSHTPPRLCGNEYTLGSKKEDLGNKEMEDFLFDLLGVGFKIGRSQIRTVLGQCGYDIQKSMQELLNISAQNSARSWTNGNGSTRKASRNSVDTQRCNPGLSRSKRDEDLAVNNNDTELSDAFSSKIGREMEVLAALFNCADRPSELPPTLSNLEVDSFQDLRRAVKDYSASKNEYYRAAVEVHAKGDRALAAKFVEQGEFFHQKARQADEESAQKIFEIRPNAKKSDDTFTLDLHEYGPREAIRLLKCHLPMLSAFRYCKLIISANEKDITKGSRKRKIIKLLKEESFQWIQGIEADTILVSTNNIDSETLIEAVTSL